MLRRSPATRTRKLAARKPGRPRKAAKRKPQVEIVEVDLTKIVELAAASGMVLTAVDRKLDRLIKHFGIVEEPAPTETEPPATPETEQS